MPRRPDKKIFLDSLNDILIELGLETIGNIKFRDHLGWNEDRYNRTKNRLVDDGEIQAMPGYGGSIKPISETDNRLTIFISYSHKDEEIKDALLNHLKPLKHLGLIKTWHDNKIVAGREIDSEISENLRNSDIVLFLISIDFINSKYCYDIEMDKALELKGEKQLEIIPIIVRNCVWRHDKMQISKLKALPKDGKAISAWADRDEALTNVSIGIKEAAEKIIKDRG